MILMLSVVVFRETASTPFFQAESIEAEISDLRKACDSMAEEVTKLTKGTGKGSFTCQFSLCDFAVRCDLARNVTALSPIDVVTNTKYKLLHFLTIVILRRK